MWGAIISAVGGAIIGGAVNAATTGKAISDKVSAYTEAAKEVRDATEKYSGRNAYQQELAEGKDLAVDSGNLAGSELAAERLQNLNPGVTGAGAMANAYNAAGVSANAANQAAQGGFSTGMSNAANTLASKYNRSTTRANQLMKQADIDYGVSTQRAQEAMNTIGNVANTYNQLRSTKNGRNYAGQEQ